MKNAAPLALATALVAAVPLAFTAEVPAIVGTWDAVISTPNGDMHSVITVKQVDGALKAEVEIDGVQRVVTDEKLDGGLFQMKVQYEGGIYEGEARATGDTLEGTWQGGGYSGTLTAKRRP